MFHEVRDLLIEWYRINGRELPWRGIDDPYKVWLSEVILQQTRVAQGMPYYHAFTNVFPTVKHLAEASEQEVLNVWQGLGYYSRARNLHAAAKYVMEHFDGVFPSNYTDLRKLKGVGDYTASAIASIVYGEPKAVIDGNVFRVISRIFLIEENIADARSRPVFAKIAAELLDAKKPGDFNQAIMDFGALQCAPKPNCGSCPLRPFCRAYGEGKQGALPIKVKNLKRTKRFLHYFFLASPDGVWLRRREGDDIWKGLYELPLIETEDEQFPLYRLHEMNLKGVKSAQMPVFKKVHKLTHRDIIGLFYELPSPPQVEGCQLVPHNQLANYPISRLIQEFFQNNEASKRHSLFE